MLFRSGRLESGPQGFPSIGQSVRKGDVLAFVVPSSGQIERANQSAQLAELRAARTLAEKRVARLRELADTVPKKDIEAAESELASLAERVTAVGGGLSNRDALTAPVSGLVASSNAVAGQVVDARELVFEVVDPKRLRVEALAYDPEVAADVASASIAVGPERVSLIFLGGARSMREQALPLMFRGEDDRLGRLAVGQPLKVYVQSRSKLQGYSVPAASLMKNPSNQTIVWVKTAPERFEPRTVTVEPLDGANVAVMSGLKAGDRVVTRAATLVNQVRYGAAMFKWLLDNSLANRLLVIIASLVLMAYWAFQLTRTPVDVFPDLKQPTVTLMTEAGEIGRAHV